MEVLFDAKDQCLALCDLLDLVRPLPGDLDGRLYGFGSRVHGQHHVVAEHLLDLLSPFGKHVIMKSSRAQRQTAGLFSQSLHKLWVAMTLVDSTVGRQKVEVVLALWIPDINTLSTGEDNGKRVVVVSSELVLSCDSTLCRRSVVLGRVDRTVGKAPSQAFSVGGHVARGEDISGCVGKPIQVQDTNEDDARQRRAERSPSQSEYEYGCFGDER